MLKIMIGYITNDIFITLSNVKLNNTEDVLLLTCIAWIAKVTNTAKVVETVPNLSKFSQQSGPCLNIKTAFSGMGIPVLKIRRSRDRLIFNMEAPPGVDA